MAYERYFDHAATTPLLPEVAQGLAESWATLFGNANSIHHPGKAAHEAVEWARAQVAEFVNAEDPSQIVFTSGATESNNWVLANFARAAVSPFEHSSIREPAHHLGHKLLANEGYRLQAAPDVDLVSVMTVNNETGALIQLPGESRRPLVHRDITQQVGKLEVDLQGIDYASFSAHKFGGIKGVGALYMRERPLEPLLRGGGQEHGLRAGTLNVPAIFAMGIAAQQAQIHLEPRRALAAACRRALLESVRSHLALDPAEGSPFILSLSFDGIEAEPLVIELDRLGFAVSSGAACSSEAVEPSPVLKALGYSDSLARGTIRVSFGWSSVVSEAADLGCAIVESLARLRRLAP